MISRRTFGRRRSSITRSRQGGFTLVELVLAMALALIVVGAGLGVYISTLYSFSDSQARIQNQDDARTGINQVTRYLRMACSSASNRTTLSDAVETAGTAEIVFYADLDGDGVAEKARYYLSGTTLKMQTVNPNLAASPPTYPAYTSNGVVIQNGVVNGSAPVFTYYYYDDVSSNLAAFSSPPTTSIDKRKVLAVKISLVVNESPRRARGPVSVSTLVQIRQRFDGGLPAS
jgi:prepilin-type N-terminal cleavage/methylation domain-containing protein